jgi:hypothetical protein
LSRRHAALQRRRCHDQHLRHFEGSPSAVECRVSALLTMTPPTHVEDRASPSRLLWIALFTAALVARCAVAALPYSGMNQPPKFGDYEAQRHWMELTLHTPLREWYAATRLPRCFL